MDKREFYAAVAAILGVEDTYTVQLSYRRRWGQRLPGNGRFEGYGLVRWFGPKLIHVASTTLNGQFTDPDAALRAIQRSRGSE